MSSQLNLQDFWCPYTLPGSVSSIKVFHVLLSNFLKPPRDLFSARARPLALSLAIGTAAAPQGNTHFVSGASPRRASLCHHGARACQYPSRLPGRGRGRTLVRHT